MEYICLEQIGNGKPIIVHVYIDLIGFSKITFFIHNLIRFANTLTFNVMYAF